MTNTNKIGHTNGVNSVIVSFDNKFMVSRERNSIKVWDAVRGVELKTLMVTDETIPFEMGLVSDSVIIWFVKENSSIN